MREQEQPTTQTMTAVEARARFSQVLDDVCRRRTRVVVEKRGIPVAAVVSINDLEQLQLLAEQRSVAMAVLQQSWDAFKDVDPTTVEQEVAAAVAAARAELRKEAKQHAQRP